jgi:hypothetical protein
VAESLMVKTEVIMETTVYENDKDYMSTDDVAALLVGLYADYKCASGNWTDDKSERYAKAVGIAIRMLTD